MLREYGTEAELLIDRSQNRIVVRGAEASRHLAGQLIEALDKAPASPARMPQPVEPGKVAGYPVAPDRMDAVADALRQQFPPSTGVRVAPDRRTSQLVVIAPPAVQAQIADYVRGETGSTDGGRVVAQRTGFGHACTAVPLAEHHVAGIRSESAASVG